MQLTIEVMCLLYIMLKYSFLKIKTTTIQHIFKMRSIGKQEMLNILGKLWNTKKNYN